MKNLKKLIPFVILLFLVGTMSSCNRGMGCPTFSLEDTVTTVVKQVPQVIKKTME